MTTDDDCYNHGIYNSPNQPVEGATRSFNMTVFEQQYICIIFLARGIVFYTHTVWTRTNPSLVTHTHTHTHTHTMQMTFPLRWLLHSSDTLNSD